MCDPSFLDARHAAHHAAQVASGWGATHLPADDAHQYANLGWNRGLAALVGRPAHGMAAGLRLAPLTWLLVRDGHVIAEHPVVGSSMAGGTAWLRTAAAAAGAPDRELRPVGYELPDHPVAAGAAFPTVAMAALATLADWFDTAHGAISEVAAGEPRASDVRCWPHHFDLATLISLDADAGDPESARSVGVGMTPGDAGIVEPYYYVTPWPYPEPRVGPPLPQGHWHAEGWFGAVLAASEWDGEKATLRAYLAAAVAASRAMLA